MYGHQTSNVYGQTSVPRQAPSRRRPRYSSFAAVFLGLTLYAFVGQVAAHGPAHSRPAPGPNVTAERLTQELLSLQDEYQGANTTRQAHLADDLEAVASTRQKFLEALLEDNPQEVLRLALPEKVRARMPVAIQKYLEDDVSMDGEFEVLHEDGPNGSRYFYFLMVGTRRYTLHFAGNPPEALTGSQVRANGIRVRRAIVLDSVTKKMHTTRAIAPSTTGARNTAVLLVNFQDQSAAAKQPYTPAFAQTTVFTNTSNFFRENSYQRTWLTGAVHGWYTLPYNSTVCDYWSIATLAKQAATKAGVNLSAYSHLIYAFPDNSCSWWGLGTVGGSPSQAWINDSALSLSVVSHEFGHNLGLYHSHSIDCGATVLGSNCTTSEYGDTLDVMGRASTGHFNAFQKELLGWLGTKLVTVQQNATYALDPYENMPGSRPQALKVLKSIDPKTGKRTWYYLEHRRNIGFDNFLSSSTYSNVLNGVVVHTGSETTMDSSYLLDMTPSTSSWYDPALAVGQSYYDAAGGVTLKTVAAGLNGAAPGVAGAQVQVTFNSINQAPVAVSTPTSQTVTQGSTATLNGAGSSDPDNDPLTYAWNFGDGSTGSGAVVSHVYNTAGTYTATLTVNDGNRTDSETATIVVQGSGSSNGAFTDSFSRADSTTLGSEWVEVLQDLNIVGNQLTNAFKPYSHIAVLRNYSGPTQYAVADFTSVDNNSKPMLGIVLRYLDTRNYYAVYRLGGPVSVLRAVKYVNGMQTVLKNVPIANPTVHTPFRLSGSITGNVISVELDGVAQFSVADSTFTTGSAGILLGTAGSAMSHSADNFSATVE
jgi:M6 family metalloprotease-like protein